MNTNCIPLTKLYCISKHENPLPPAKTQYHFHRVWTVKAKYILLLTYSDSQALPDHLLQIITAKIESFTFIITSPPPLLPEDPKIHPVS